MPTTLARHAVTETPDIAAALEVAARRWPEDRDRPARLLKRLIEAGREAIDEAARVDVERRREVVLRLSGSLSGAYPPGYLDELRAEWPE